MRRSTRVITAFAAICLTAFPVFAQRERQKIEIVPPRDYKAPAIENSPELQTNLTASMADVLNAYPQHGFKADDIAATLIDLRDPNNLRWANVGGDRQIYPASVVKMFYMAALERQLQDGKVTMTPEMERGLHDMIVDSSNEATQYILDVLTDTSSGAELPPKEFEKWQYHRNRVNRFYSAMGYQNINVNQKFDITSREFNKPITLPAFL